MEWSAWKCFFVMTLFSDTLLSWNNKACGKAAPDWLLIDVRARFSWRTAGYDVTIKHKSALDGRWLTLLTIKLYAGHVYLPRASLEQIVAVGDLGQGAPASPRPIVFFMTVTRFIWKEGDNVPYRGEAIIHLLLLLLGWGCYRQTVVCYSGSC